MAIDITKPADNEYLSAAPAELRENVRALKDDKVVNADKLRDLVPGNASGNIPVSNGTLCTNLNADKLDGQDGSYYSPTTHVHSVATTSSNGFISNTDKTKLDGIATGAEVNQNAFSNVLVGATTIQADGKTDTLEFVAGTGITLTPDAANDKVTVAVTQDGHTHANATTGAAGFMSSTDKSKLDGIATGAEVNQNAFSNVLVGATTIQADGKTDTLEFVAGTGITLTPDATNDKVTIAVTQDGHTHAAAATGAAGFISASDKTKLDGIATGAEVNQNTFSNVLVGGQTLAADSKADSLTINAGTGITLTGDAANDAFTIAVTQDGHTHANATTGAAGFMSSTDKTKLDGIYAGAEVNQNAFSNVLIGSTTIQADGKTDTLELVAGMNIALTPDATNDKVTIAVSGTVANASYATNAGNSDTVDNKHAADFVQVASSNTITLDGAPLRFKAATTTGNTSCFIDWLNNSGTETAWLGRSGSDDFTVSGGGSNLKLVGANIYANNNLVIHAGNIGSQSVNYATTAGTANSIKASTSSYGSCDIVSSKGGYSGVHFPDDGKTWVGNKNGSVSFGVYRDTGGWDFYFDNAGVLQVGTVPWSKLSGVPSLFSYGTTNTFTGNNIIDRYSNVEANSDSGYDWTSGSGAYASYRRHVVGTIGAGTYALSTVLQNLINSCHVHQVERILSANCAGCCGSGCTTCFLAGTKILMADGTTKNIEDIVVGDKVVGAGRINIVQDIYTSFVGNNRSVRSVAINGERVGAFGTSDHLYWVKSRGQEGFGTHDYNEYLGRLNKNGNMAYLSRQPIIIPTHEATEYYHYKYGWVEGHSIVSNEHGKDEPVWTLFLDGDCSYYADGFLVSGKPIYPNQLDLVKEITPVEKVVVAN